MQETKAGVMPGRSMLVVGLFLSVFGVAFEMIGIATALPTIMGVFDAEGLYAWAFSSFVIGQLLATIIAGRVADRVGPLLPMAAGFVLFMTGLVAATMASSVWWLFAARLVQGLGAGALTLTLYVTIALAFHGHERASILGWISFVWLLPAFVGPPVAAGLVEISWRWVFAIMIPFLVVAALLAARPMLRVQKLFSPGAHKVRLPWWAVLAVALSPGFIQFAGEGFGWWSVVAGIVGAVALVTGLRKVMPKAINLVGRGLGAVVLSRALQAGCFFAAEAFLLLVLQRMRGLDPLEAGIILTIGSTGWTLGAWVQARPWTRLRRDQLISVGTGLVLLGLIIICTFVMVNLPVWVALAGWVFAGLGMGVQLPSTAVAVMDLSHAQEQGANNSALQVAEGLGNALLTGLAGAIYAAVAREAGLGASFTTLFAVLVVICAAALVGTRRIGPIANSSLRGAQRVK